jgi:endonuclease/exonuclease/phosphatase family metal-dependent hydrolase
MAPSEKKNASPQEAHVRHVVARRATWWMAWGYLAAVALVWALMRWSGDHWWIGTLLLFGPRWFCLLPLVVLFPLAATVRRSAFWPLSAAAFMAVGPLCGFCVPCARLLGDDAPTIRILTCNLKGHSLNNQRLEALVAKSKPDIVALQGCWDGIEIRWPDGWHMVRTGELVVASRFPVQEILGTSHSRTGHAEPRANLLSCSMNLPDGELSFATVHLQSPHYGIDSAVRHQVDANSSRTELLSEETDARWKESEEVATRLADRGRTEVVVGDLNLPVESPIYRTYWSSWADAFSSTGWGFGATEWPQETPGGIRIAIRIDHILTGPAWRSKRCWVGPDVGSDHLPLIADLYRRP